MALLKRRILTPYEQYLRFALASLKPCIHFGNTPCTHVNCSHTCKKNGYCIDCLNDILTNDNSITSRLREYSCENITYSYVLRYLNRYASEIYHLFEKAQFTKRQVVNIISLGCGPATELVGFESIYHKMNPTGIINFFGFDTNAIWSSCQNQLGRIYNSYNVNCTFFNQVLLPDNQFLKNTDLLILNYVVSHIHKHVNTSDKSIREKAVESFLNTIISPIFDNMPSGSILLINDTNSYNLGRNQIEKWTRSQSQKAISLITGLYPNPDKPYARFNYNNTIMQDVSLVYQKNSPYDKYQISIDSCGSAFILIKKR